MNPRQPPPSRPCLVTLALFGKSLDPDAVTRALELEPTVAWRRGQVAPPSSPPRPTGRWAYELRDADFEPAIRELLAALEPRKERLDVLTAAGQVEDILIDLWWEPEYEVGDYHLSTELIARLAKLGHAFRFFFVPRVPPEPTGRIEDGEPGAE